MAFRARKVFGSFEKRTPGFCDEYPRDVVKPARLRNDVKNSKCSLECKNLSIYRSITEAYFSYCCIAWDTVVTRKWLFAKITKQSGTYYNCCHLLEKI